MWLSAGHPAVESEGDARIFERGEAVHGLVGTAVAALLVVGGAVGSPRTEQDGRSSLQRQMDALVAAGVPGVVVLVHGKNGTLRLASGHSNLARKTPMRVTDRFRVGSITKSFVATVVLQLVGEGKLSLDDTVEHRLPGVVPNGEKITLRNLLATEAGSTTTSPTRGW